MTQITIIAAGGTIDANEYDFKTGSVISFGNPAALEIVKKVMPGIASKNIILTSPFQKDSDVMNDRDREQLLELCKSCECDRIVITHGTGTIIDTGLLLASRLNSKTVVLTGSLPYGLEPTNAAFNLGSAITACTLLPPGVYIATSGEIVSLAEKKITKMKSGEVTYFLKESVE
jgi:L-asparaginase